MKHAAFIIIIGISLAIISSPALAITAPSDEDAAWLRTAPDLQERIARNESLLEPLLNPSANPLGVIETFGKGIIRNFDITSADEGYLERYDKNSDTVIDERDFIEMAFDHTLMVREAQNSPTHGEARCAVLLIKFPDVAPQTEHDSAYWQEMFFGESFYTTRSYYVQCSDNQLFINGDVLVNPDEPDGYWVAAHNKDYYDWDSDDLLGEVLDYADDYYDFSQYDADDNAEADGVYFIYAGETDNWGDFYWGWATYGGYIVDGVRVGPLMFCGEFLMTYRVAAHEFGHMMGLPDLYDYTFVSWGVGKWALMGKGEVYMCPWSRMKLGWADMVDLSMDRYGEVIYPQVQNPPIFRLWTEGQSSTEYFLVSFAKKESYDQKLPGEGLMIWHCDEYGSNNNWQHKRVDVEEADGNDDLDDSTNDGDPTDPYYDPNNTTFDHDSYPNSDNYAGQPTLVEVINISEIGDEFMVADLKVGIPGDIPTDETEPNNVWDDSGVKFIMPPNGITDGRVDGYSDPSDFWSFVTFGPGIVSADLISYNENINFNLFLWNMDGTEVMASAETTLSNEHLEAYLPQAGLYYFEVRVDSKSGYYDIRAELKNLPSEGKIDAYGADILPDVIYANTLTIPALRLSLLNGGGIPSTLNEMRVYATGGAHYMAMSAELWLDNGDAVFGPGLDEHLAGPVPLDTENQSLRFLDLNYELGPGTELFVTLDLGPTQFFGAEIGLRMFAYKDLVVDGGMVEYHNFPLSTKKALAFNPPMQLCYVAAGDFVMGSDPPNDPYYDDDCDFNEETPVHTNRTGDYYISRYEINNAQYGEFIADGGYTNHSYWDSGWNWKNNNNITAPNGWNGGEYPIGDDYPDYPVAGASQYEARAYAKYTGGRLPHEAEWEKSGRGTDARLFTYGNVYDGSKYFGGFPLIPVGSYPESDSLYGVADLHGNAFEWMEDGWLWGLYEIYKSGAFTPPSSGSYAMQRGYSWLLVGDCGPDYATRLPFRDTWPRTYRWTFVGFRVVFDSP